MKITKTKKSEKVAVTLIESFDYAASRRREYKLNSNLEEADYFYRREFLRGVTQLVRASDKKALQADPRIIPDGHVVHLMLEGDAKKITAALRDIFKEAHEHRRAIFSEFETKSERLDAHEVSVMLTDSLPNIVKKEATLHTIKMTGKPGA